MGENIKGITDVKIAKHRNGTLETIKLKALLHIQKFTNGMKIHTVVLACPARWLETGMIDGGGGEKLYIQTGSKMNDMTKDDERSFLIVMWK